MEEQNQEPPGEAVVETAAAEAVAEDDDDNDDNLLQLPDYLRGPLDPSRMELTDEERQWALEVKDALECVPDLDVTSLSDFMIAQIALVEWESQDLQHCIDHAHNLQNYRREYDIRETYEQGRRCLEYYIHRHPGYMLHFFYNNSSSSSQSSSTNRRSEGRYTICIDMTKFDTSVLRETKGRQKTFQSAYYFNHAFCTDLAAIREGVDWMMECEGFLWKAPKMVNLEVFRMGFEDVATHYPFHLHQFKFFNTGVLVNTLASMVKKYTPERIRKTFDMGHATDVRMDKICLVPNVGIAMNRIIREMTQAMKRRYEAERTFRLS